MYKLWIDILKCYYCNPSAKSLFVQETSTNAKKTASPPFLSAFTPFGSECNVTKEKKRTLLLLSIDSLSLVPTKSWKILFNHKERKKLQIHGLMRTWNHLSISSHTLFLKSGKEPTRQFSSLFCYLLSLADTTDRRFFMCTQEREREGVCVCVCVCVKSDIR